MKLTIFFIIFSSLIIEIYAKQTELKELIFKPYKNNKNKELVIDNDITTFKTEVLVRSNTLLKVFGNYNPSSLNKNWYVDNEDEIKNSNLIEYKGNEYDTKNCYDYEDCVGKVYLNFHIKDINVDNENQLPKLKIVEFESSNEKMIIEITIKFNTEEEIPPKEYTYNVQEYSSEIGIEANSLINLQFNNFSPDEGINWIFDLEEYFETSEDDSIEYLGKEIKSDENGTVFKFRINEVLEYSGKHLLSFIMQEPEGQHRINVQLKPKEKDQPKEFTLIPKESDKELEVEVEPNFLLNIELPYDHSSGYRWILRNEKEVSESEHIELKSQGYKSSCNTITPGIDPSDCTGIDIFKFRITNVTDEKQLPKLTLIRRIIWVIKRKRSTDDIEEEKSLEITLKLKNHGNNNDDDKDDDSENKCSFHGYSCCAKANPKVRYQDKDGDWGVENGQWCFIKKKEEGEEKESGSTCFSQALGYSCCKKHVVVYTDKSGEWGYENGQWCGIIACPFTEKDGYPVCKTTDKVVYTDKKGEWGVENKKWCIICN